MLNERVFARLKSDARLRARLPAIEAAVAEGRLVGRRWRSKKSQRLLGI